MSPDRAKSKVKIYRSTKFYPHSLGLSCCFRQWRAESHCRFLHGYAIAVKLTFACYEKDKNGWVMDFGGLKPVKEWLCQTFDHRSMVALDDPHLLEYERWAGLGLMQLNVLNAVGIEAFAKLIREFVEPFLECTRVRRNGSDLPRVWLESVEVFEHEGNSAID